MVSERARGDTMGRDVVARLREYAVAAGPRGGMRSTRKAMLDAADEIVDLRAEVERLRAVQDIAQDQSRQWAALGTAMSLEFADEPESVPGRNVGECAVALIRRLRAAASPEPVGYVVIETYVMASEKMPHLLVVDGAVLTKREAITFASRMSRTFIASHYTVRYTVHAVAPATTEATEDRP
jgi:hypothetical protein